MRSATGLLERRHFIIERLPPSAENMAARDDHIDLMGTRFHRPANLRDTPRQWRQTCGESSGDCRDVNPAPLQGMQRGLDEGVIDAHRAHLDAEFLDPELLYELLLNGLPRLRAQPPHSLIGIIARERGQIHAGDRTQKPRGLPFFFYRAARHLRLDAAFHGARIDSNFLQPIQIERNAGVRKKLASGEYRDRAGGMQVCGPNSGLGLAREVRIAVIDGHCRSALYRFSESASP